MLRTKETDKFIVNKNSNVSSSSDSCNSIWWNRAYHHQHVICRIIESFAFRALIIFLVILDTSLLIAAIMLDTFKIQYECKIHLGDSSRRTYELVKEHVDLAIEIAHYSSIIILSFFLIELIVRIYANGKEFWNIRRKKMEYFDATIVIASFAVDLYFLFFEEKILSKKLYIFSFRLWRFVRIISSVAEGVHDEQIKHKRRLNKHYLIAVRRLVDLLLHKTNHVEDNGEYVNSILSYFRSIDAKCQSALDNLENNHQLSSSAIVAQFVEELNAFEDKNANIENTELCVKSSDV